MKTLYLLRHGKSDWEANYGKDHERPLARRGRSAAVLMGRFLAALVQAPERVVTSSAVRARETVRLAAEAGGWSCPVETTEELYGVSPEGALELIRAQDDAFDRVLLAGHEPTWSLLAGGLVGGGRLKFPTAAMARVDMDIRGWEAAGFGRGVLVWHVTPKLLDRIGWKPLA